VLVGECKWGSVSASDLKTLRTRASLLLRDLKADPQQVHIALFSGRAIAREVEQEVEAGRVLHFSPDSLYPESGS
jgi:hypothetical protein